MQIHSSKLFIDWMKFSVLIKSKEISFSTISQTLRKIEWIKKVVLDETLALIEQLSFVKEERFGEMKESLLLIYK